MVATQPSRTWKDNRRIRYLLARWGPEKTAQWAKATLENYRAACRDPHHYSAYHKRTFRKEIRELEAFLESDSAHSE